MVYHIYRYIKNQETNKSLLDEHGLEENHKIQTIKLLKHVQNDHEFNIRESLEMIRIKTICLIGILAQYKITY